MSYAVSNNRSTKVAIQGPQKQKPALTILDCFASLAMTKNLIGFLPLATTALRRQPCEGSPAQAEAVSGR